MRQKDTLSTTNFVIVACLLDGDKSGYDVKKYLHAHMAHIFASPSGTQVYSALNLAMQLGYATVTFTRDTMMPMKYTYTLTTAGKEALIAWIHGHPDSDSIKHPLLAQLWFAQYDTKNACVPLLEDRLAAAKTQIETLITQQTHETNPWRKATFTHAIAATLAEIQWLETYIPAAVA